MQKIIIVYLIFINLSAAAVCIADKSKAKRHKWRISEKTLWLISLSGGSMGMYLTMLLIRHKTLHSRFMIGLPLLIIIQIALICLLTNYDVRHIIKM